MCTTSLEISYEKRRNLGGNTPIESSAAHTRNKTKDSKTTTKIKIMIIRKKYKFEGAHIVRNCSSDRCKRSLHGHSYIVEVFFTANSLDNGQMVLDFGLTKGRIGDLVDSFDHAYSMWRIETPKFKTFINQNSERVVEMPVSPSAEMYSLMFFFIIDKMLENTVFNNGEQGVRLHSVRVHETETGYAESFREDLSMWKYQLEDIKFSEAIISEWKDKEMWKKLLEKTPFVNPVIEVTHFEE